MKSRIITIIAAGLMAAGTMPPAFAITIDSIDRSVTATYLGSDNTISSNLDGSFSQTVFQDSPDGTLPPVSGASQLSYVQNLGSSLELNAAGSQGGWAGVSANVFRRGGSASSILDLLFTVSTNAEWEWLGGLAQLTNSSYSSVFLMDMDTLTNIFFDDSTSGGTLNQTGILTAGHQYRFNMLSESSYDPSGGTGSLSEGTFFVNEVNSVPEPTPIALLSLGLATMMGFRAKKKLSADKFVA